MLLVSGDKAESEKLEKAIKEAQVPALLKLAKILCVKSVSVLGSGKVD